MISILGSFERKNKIKWDYDVEANVLYISFGVTILNPLKGDAKNPTP
jgi:hypothetical protein